MKKLMILSILVSSIVSGEEAVICKPVAVCTTPVCTPVCSYPRKRVIHKVVQVPKPQERIVVVNNNTNVNNCGTSAEPKVIVRKVVVEKTVREEGNKNALSVLLGRTSTGLKASQNSSDSVLARTTGQFDIGGLYQHDFGVLRLSVGATINSSVYGGLGITF